MEFVTNTSVRWADIDQNGHVRHSAYYDYGADSRIRFLDQLGFGSTAFLKLGIGPILFTEQCSFIRELHLNETLSISLLRGHVREDGSQWELYHEICNSKDQKAAHIKVKGAWMDLKARKVTQPPGDLAKAFLSLPQGADYSYQKAG